MIALPERSEKRLLIALTLLLVTISAGTVGFKYLTGKHHDWLDCLYMTVITLSTVGFGETIETSQFAGARVFTIFLILTGIGIWIYVLGTLTSIMMETDLFDLFKRIKMKRDLNHIRKHFIVCGAGRTGTCIAQELLRTGIDFVVIERDPERIEELSKLGDVLHIRGDATDDETLIEAGIDRAAGLAATLTSEKDNLFLTLTARQLNPSIRIVARGLDEGVNRKLRKAGADATVSPTIIGGLRMASELIRPSVVSFLDTMLRDVTGTIRFEEMHITRDSSFVNQTIKSTKLREDSNLLIVALRRQDDMHFQYNPPADTTLTDGMTLVLLGESAHINKLKEAHGIEF